MGAEGTGLVNGGKKRLLLRSTTSGTLQECAGYSFEQYCCIVIFAPLWWVGFSSISEISYLLVFEKEKYSKVQFGSDP